ncbi:ATP-binding protein [Kitasatospora sp. GP82]|uniref:ATP-binding protein n=1 Tax=Kitasatospora sp. GP82 TaxID=3035089 RepID=UPI0024740674|nr:ATP-binding protein [Kitasatospora sp. GP82]MDH6129025.1 anti-sigma regulatory factor (Ser/Thr protein kinase) [Kitasatospora sp. GP82]
MNSIARTRTDGDRRGFGDARRLDLSTAQHAVTTARDFTRDVLAGWELGERAGSDAVLVVCELVANAAQHTGGPRALRLSRSRTALRIEVSDTDPAAPTPRPPGVGRPGGYGLIVLERLCHRWGSDPHPAGKTVWAEILLTPPRPGRSPVQVSTHQPRQPQHPKAGS